MTALHLGIMITWLKPLNIEAGIKFLKHQHENSLNCKGVQRSCRWHLHSRGVTIYSLTILQIISTCIIVHRRIQLQDPSPTPSPPPHSFIHSPGGRGSQCLWPRGVHTSTQTRTQAGSMPVHACTHTLFSVLLSFSSMALNP